jgi:hypothetical protein
MGMMNLKMSYDLALTPPLANIHPTPLNLRPLIFSLTLFSWLHSITPSSHFLKEYQF